MKVRRTERRAGADNPDWHDGLAGPSRLDKQKEDEEEEDEDGRPSWFDEDDQDDLESLISPAPEPHPDVNNFAVLNSSLPQPQSAASDPHSASEPHHLQSYMSAKRAGAGTR